jgi:hypothetical protein
MYRAFCLVIMTLILPIFSIAQTPERVVDEQQPINQKTVQANHRISGTVTMKVDNQPVAKANIELRGIRRPATGTQVFWIHAVTDEQGRWSIDKVPDDDYLISVNPTGLTAGTKFVSQNREVKMAGADIENIAFQVIKGGRITGKVIMNDGEPIPKNLLIIPGQTITSSRSQVKTALVQPDGSFILENVPTGDILLKARVFGKPNEYFMKTATVGEIDLMHEPIRIEDGVEVKDVKFYLQR